MTCRMTYPMVDEYRFREVVILGGLNFSNSREALTKRLFT